MKTTFPFPGKLGQDENRALISALSQSAEGLYFVGKNNLWNGGIDIDDSMSEMLDIDKPVRCFADGEVVAWRLSEEYPWLDVKGETVLFSPGFVLVRHTWKAADKDSFTFFSLYMHLADYASIKNNPAWNLPVWQTEKSVYQSSPPESVADHGLPFYTDPAGCNLHFLIPAKEKAPFTRLYYAEPSEPLTQGQMIPVEYVDETEKHYSGYLRYDASLVEREGTGAGLSIKNNINRLAQGVNLRDVPKGRIRYVLPHGSEVTLVTNVDRKNWGRVSSIRLPDGSIETYAQASVYFPELKYIGRGVAARDEIVVPSSPIAIRRGDPVGYIGTNQGVFGRSANRSMHMELFTGDNFRVYLNRQRGKGERLRQQIKNKRAEIRTTRSSAIARSLRAQVDALKRQLPIVRLATGTTLYRESAALKNGEIPEKTVLRKVAERGSYVQLALEGQGPLGKVDRIQHVDYDVGTNSYIALDWPYVMAQLEVNSFEGVVLKFASYSTNDGKPSKTRSGNWRLIYIENQRGNVWVSKSRMAGLLALKTDFYYTENPITGWQVFPESQMSPDPDWKQAPYDVYNDIQGLSVREEGGIKWYQLKLQKSTRSEDCGKLQETWVSGDDLEHYSPDEFPGFEIVEERMVQGGDCNSQTISPVDDPVINTRLLPEGWQQLVNSLKTTQVTSNGKTLNAYACDSLKEKLLRAVLFYPSEWKVDRNMRDWRSARSMILEQATGMSPADKDLAWGLELERRKQLAWWDQVDNSNIKGFPSSSRVYHFHPASFTGAEVVVAPPAQHKLLTVEQFRSILPSDVRRKGLFYKSRFQGVRDYHLEDFVDLLNKYMNRYEINTKWRIVHFLAQITLECDSFRTTEEYRNSGGSIPSHWYRYRGGHVYHGRGLIQLTHIENYAKYKKDTGADVVNNPSIVAWNMEHTVRSACWYWRYASPWGDINKRADRNDFLFVTVAINGGFNHARTRKSHLQTLARSFGLPSRNFSRFWFSNSGLSKTRSGRSIWKRYFGNQRYI
jgi:predicted chitinase